MPCHSARYAMCSHTAVPQHSAVAAPLALKDTPIVRHSLSPQIYRLFFIIMPTDGGVSLASVTLTEDRTIAPPALPFQIRRTTLLLPGGDTSSQQRSDGSPAWWPPMARQTAILADLPWAAELPGTTTAVRRRPDDFIRRAWVRCYETAERAGVDAWHHHYRRFNREQHGFCIMTFLGNGRQIRLIRRGTATC